EVFDDGSFIKESTGNFLVLVGHTAGQSSHRPLVKVFAVSGSDVTDQTDKAVPPMPGEGAATLAHNKKDIFAKISLLSIGQAEMLFNSKQVEPLPIEDESVRHDLSWKDGRYTMSTNYNSGPLFALYAVAKCLKEHDNLSNYATTISAKAKKT